MVKVKNVFTCVRMSWIEIQRHPFLFATLLWIQAIQCSISYLYTAFYLIFSSGFQRLSCLIFVSGKISSYLFLQSHTVALISNVCFDAPVSNAWEIFFICKRWSRFFPRKQCYLYCSPIEALHTAASQPKLTYPPHLIFWKWIWDILCFIYTEVCFFL